MIAGRRGGKSRIAALVAVCVSAFTDWRKRLAVGEVATFMVLAQDRRQARTILAYVKGLLEHPMLKPLVREEGKESILLSTGVRIEVHTASFCSVRGYTLVGAICDELAFWRSDESANPDKEIVAALRPGLATLGDFLLGISSPYARRGVLYDMFRRHHGQDDSGVLVWKAPARTMNPSLSAEIVEQAKADDPVAAASEWDAEFRSDLESYVSEEALNSCVVPGRSVQYPVPPTKYWAFVDPSGGRADSFTLAIGHVERRKEPVVIVDRLEERKPPFSPDAVAKEFAAICQDYRVRRVAGDKYAGEWPRDRFAAHGVSYRPTARPKTQLYQEALAWINGGRVELPDHPRLLAQFLGLERRTGRGTGREVIDHFPGAHDDLANAVAGVIVEAGPRRRSEVVSFQVNF